MGKLVRVEGEAFVRTDAKTINIELYEEEFILDDTVKSISEARSIIKNGLLNERLKKKIKHYKDYRTYEVTKFSDTEKTPEHSDYDKLLMEATKLQCIPENLDAYASDDGKEKALKKAIKRAKERKAADAKKEKTAAVQDQGYVD